MCVRTREQDFASQMRMPSELICDYRLWAQVVNQTLIRNVGKLVWNRQKMPIKGQLIGVYQRQTGLLQHLVFSDFTKLFALQRIFLFFICKLITVNIYKKYLMLYLTLPAVLRWIFEIIIFELLLLNSELDEIRFTSISEWI